MTPTNSLVLTNHSVSRSTLGASGLNSNKLHSQNSAKQNFCRETFHQTDQRLREQDRRAIGLNGRRASDNANLSFNSERGSSQGPKAYTFGKKLAVHSTPFIAQFISQQINLRGEQVTNNVAAKAAAAYEATENYQIADAITVLPLSVQT